MKVSILVCLYNAEKHLKRCINSIINQNYSNLEVILINDGSTDLSGEICDEYMKIDSRIKVYHKKNEGIACTRNFGIQKITGDCFFFVDADDWITNNCISTLVNEMISRNSDVCVGNYLTVKNANIKQSDKQTHSDFEVKSNPDTLVKYLKEELYSPCGKLYKVDFWNKFGFVYPEGRIYEDITVTFDIFKQANKISFTNQIIYFYWRLDESITRRCFSKKNLDAIVAFENLCKLSIDCDLQIQNLAKFRLHRSYYAILGIIAFYGWDSYYENKEETLHFLIKKFHMYFKELVFSPYESLKRKIPMIMLRLSFPLTCFCSKIFVKILGR